MHTGYDTNSPTDTVERMRLRAVVCAVSMASATVLIVSLPRNVQAMVANSIDVTNRQAVIDSYVAEFDRAEPAMEFTGSVASCTPGTTSSAYQTSVLQRVNWYRQMAGLPAIVYNPANHAAAQAGALISAAQGSLSHTPSSSAKCYSALGYTGTSRSNLALGGAGVKAIDMYIDDYGPNNTGVGHRRWILSPELRGVATGDIPAATDRSNWSANALYVFDTGSPVATRDGAIAWPPPGYVPNKVVYGRWSYVRLGANFSNAQVTVTGPSGAVSTTVENRSDFMGPGIVFTPNVAPSRSTDTTYTVTITGVTGAPSSTITYNVTVVPINAAPQLTTISASGNRCSGRSVYIYPTLDDKENDAITLGFADQSGDAALFSIGTFGSNKSWYYLSPRASLDPSRSTYTFTFRVTDSLGASRIETSTVTIDEPGSKVLCSPRNLSIKRTRSGTSVKWTTVSLGAKPTKFTVKIGSRRCTTTKTSCVIKGLARGRHTVTVTAYRTGVYSESTTSRLVLK
jgi:uncharacterized protein YkwD